MFNVPGTETKLSLTISRQSPLWPVLYSEPNPQVLYTSYRLYLGKPPGFNLARLPFRIIAGYALIWQRDFRSYVPLVPLVNTITYGLELQKDQYYQNFLHIVTRYEHNKSSLLPRYEALTRNVSVSFYES